MMTKKNVGISIFMNMCVCVREGEQLNVQRLGERPISWQGMDLVERFVKGGTKQKRTKM